MILWLTLINLTLKNWEDSFCVRLLIAGFCSVRLRWIFYPYVNSLMHYINLQFPMYWNWIQIRDVRTMKVKLLQEHALDSWTLSQISMKKEIRIEILRLLFGQIPFGLGHPCNGSSRHGFL
jgi:hypothetical protein